MSRTSLCFALALVILTAPTLAAKEERLAPEDRILLTRELTAEYATAKVILPRSKKPLPLDTEGNRDMARWTDAHDQYGPAARLGDVVQITKIEFEKKRIVLTINGGFKGGRKWYERIQLGGTTSATTLPTGRRRA
ncbi:MAG: hypothetical protein GY953_20585, partial [bacterium]|nr:hypothetical protein [bacterium]